jgi:hypothetical protein
VVFAVGGNPHENCDQAASADAASDECSSADGPLVVAGPAVVPLVAFIDCSVKPPVNDRARSVTVPYLAPYDWSPKEVE